MYSGVIFPGVVLGIVRLAAFVNMDAKTSTSVSAIIVEIYDPWVWLRISSLSLFLNIIQFALQFTCLDVCGWILTGSSFEKTMAKWSVQRLSNFYSKCLLTKFVGQLWNIYHFWGENMYLDLEGSNYQFSIT